MGLGRGERQNGTVTDPFAHAGALLPAYRAVDWAETPLGPVDSWSAALRGALDITLNTGFPITLLWGPEAVLLYNDSYLPNLAEKHPAALGRPAREVFAEAWDLVGALHRQVMEDDQAVYIEDALVPLMRNGFLTEEYFTFAYSPVHGLDGRVEGVMDIVATTTTQVVLERRLLLLTRLGRALASVERTDEVLGRALDVLAGDVSDIVRTEVARSAASEEVVTDASGDRVFWTRLHNRGPLDIGALGFTLSPLLAADDDYLDFLALLTRTVDQTLDRVHAIESERSLSEALQRSLLTSPPTNLIGAEIAARYQPAGQLAQVGGDWYDSFRLPDGSLALVVGDVAGHDQDAAATMAQLRNLAAASPTPWRPLRRPSSVAWIARSRGSSSTSSPAPCSSSSTSRPPPHGGRARDIRRRCSSRRTVRPGSSTPDRTCSWASTRGPTATTTSWPCPPDRCWCSTRTASSSVAAPRFRTVSTTWSPGSPADSPSVPTRSVRHSWTRRGWARTTSRSSSCGSSRPRDGSRTDHHLSG